jgi:hypothetical protein
LDRTRDGKAAIADTKHRVDGTRGAVDTTNPGVCSNVSDMMFGSLPAIQHTEIGLLPSTDDRLALPFIKALLDKTWFWGRSRLRALTW